MNATNNIVESGLRPEAPDAKVMALADQICAVLGKTISDSLARIRAAESDAIRRLNEYVPNEPLMDSKQAAAYLRIPLRALHLLTCPKNIEIPFNWLNNKKRFRKVQLDAWLLRNEVKRTETRP